MLGNHADAFYLTPMKTSVLAGGNQNPLMMPSPRHTYGGSQVDALNQSVAFAGCDGCGADPVVEAPTSIMDTLKKPWVIAAIAAGVLIFTPFGKKVLGKVGLG
jgi:hypothetical protein